MYIYSQRFYRSNKFPAKLLEAKEKLKMPRTKIVTMSATRFSSSFTLMQSLIESRAALELLIEDDVLSSDSSTNNRLKKLITDFEFFSNLQLVLKIIQPLASLIKMSESSARSMSDTYAGVLKLTAKIRKFHNDSRLTLDIKILFFQYTARKLIKSLRMNISN